jgi:hypothetical protein
MSTPSDTNNSFLVESPIAMNKAVEEKEKEKE